MVETSREPKADCSAISTCLGDTPRLAALSRLISRRTSGFLRCSSLVTVGTVTTADSSRETASWNRGSNGWSSATISQVPIRQWTTPEGELVFTESVLAALADEATHAAYSIIEGKGATNYAIGLTGARLTEVLLKERDAAASGRPPAPPAQPHTEAFRMSDLLPLLSDLTNVNGVSGFEAPVARIVKSHLQDICEITGDHLGSVICRLNSSGPGPKVALAGHLDEIGFMVNIVTKEGFVKFLNLGGWWDQVLLAQRVVIETHKGPVMGVRYQDPASPPPTVSPVPLRLRDEVRTIQAAS